MLTGSRSVLEVQAYHRQRDFGASALRGDDLRRGRTVDKAFAGKTVGGVRTRGARGVHVDAEAADLIVLGAVVVIEVEAGFAKGHDLWVLGQGGEFLDIHGRLNAGFMRMNSDGTGHIVEALGHDGDVVAALVGGPARRVDAQ